MNEGKVSEVAELQVAMVVASGMITSRQRQWTKDYREEDNREEGNREEGNREEGKREEGHREEELEEEIEETVCSKADE